MKEIFNNQNNRINTINNNLSNIFNNADLFINKNKVIEEINIGDEEDEKIENNTNIKINNINSNNKENKIMSIDLNINNNNLNKKTEEKEEKKEEQKEEEKEEKKAEEKEKEKEKEEEKEEEKNNNNNLNENKENQENKENKKNNDMDISDNENIENKDDKKNYTTPESKEKSIVQLYESLNEEGNKKQGSKEINNFNNDNLQFSDFNNIMNNEEENKEIQNEELIINNNKKEDNNKKYINKRIIINVDEKNENNDTYKKRNNNNDNKNYLKIKQNNVINSEKEINLSDSNNNILKDSFNSNQNIKMPESSPIDINKEKKIKAFDIESNSQTSISSYSKKTNKNLINEFLKYKIIDKYNHKIIFSHNNNLINNNTYSIPLQSYIYILQLCLKKKLAQEKKYELFTRKLMNKVNKNKFINKSGNIISKNNEYENKINNEIENFESKIKTLKNYYIYLITKKSGLKTKKEKEKIEEEIDIPKKQNYVNAFFNNLILLINNNNINDRDKYNLYMKKIKNILKKYEKINKNELSEAKSKDKVNKLNIPENDEDFYKKEDQNLIYDLKKGKSKKIFVITSILLPLFYILNYFNSYSKNV